MVYLPHCQPSHDTPPVLIEVQNTVNTEFMTRAISYCVSAFQTYRTRPIMIILTTNGFSSSQLKEDLQTDAPDFKYSIHAISDSWAQKCLILTAESVDPFIRHNPINNLVALEYVLSSQKSSITSLERRDDPTVQLLYSICAEKVKEEMPQEIAQILGFINTCNEMNDIFKDILAIDEPSQTGLRQIREHAQKGSISTKIRSKSTEIYKPS